MDQKIILTVVVPIFNEQENLELLIRRVVSAIENITLNYELMFVDDGSSDHSLEFIQKACSTNQHIKYLSFSRNFGHQAAYLAGLEHANGNCIVMMDGDLQDPPEFIESLYLELQKGYDVVYAIRKKRKESYLKRFFYSFFYRLLKFISKTDIPLDSGDFCIMTANVKSHLLESTEYNLFIRGSRAWIGFKQTGLEYERDKRYAGKSKFSLKNLLKLAYNGIYSFSEFPIKILTSLGLVVILISILYSIYTLYVKFHNPHMPQGFTTLAIAIFLFGGIQLVALGIIGEYVIRIYDETRKRPKYIIRNKLI